MNSTGKIMTGIIIIIGLSISIIYIQFMNLEVYDRNGILIIKDGNTYQDSSELLVKYLNGEIKAERIIGRFKVDRIIGRFKEDKFLGFKTWVIKLKDFDPNEAFLIRGLMFEAVYVKQHR